MLEPNIYKYLSFRTYLEDWFETRKAEDPKFSKRSFARLAGKSSPGLFSEIVNGRRLTRRMVSAIAKGLNLSRAEADFFDAIVLLDQATTTADRNHAWERISAARQFHEAQPVEGASFRYLSEWWIPVVKELGHRSDFRADPRWIVARIRPSISEAQASRALEVLFELGFLKTDEHGETRLTEGTLATPQEVAGLAAHNYHLGMLERAKDAIDGFEPTQRHFLAATVSVPSDLVGLLKKEMNEFHRRMLDLCGAFEGNADEVLQMHLLLFPLSDSASGADE